ncbi:ROK family protein [Microbacterium sp. ARD32]|uniref:ROK family protein n=1 Tax=Microbacterium sp. ARD32 TaxID=2962577 RepID=UPI002882A21E|nr:ROK family protein [Microbacterium sp. ARD32]MDT0158236.1 ROK family protein [Microbacterium sp. ARD32]
MNRLIDRMIQDREVEEIGQTSSTGGRPARLVRFNASAHAVLAVELGGHRISAAVTDLDAQVLLRDACLVDSQVRGAGRDVFEAVAVLASGLIEKAATQRIEVRTVCVGVPGVVRHRRGLVEFAPAVQWFDFPLVPLLEERLGVAVRVENDVNLAAVAELRHGAARGRSDVLTVLLGTGVGAALILDGRLYRGAVGAAGEFGYTMMSRSSLDSPWPGFGDLESRIGAAGVLRRHGYTSVTEPDAESLLARVRGGDPVARAVFDGLVDDLALSIANASALLNPELVVLGGESGRAAAELMLPAIGRRLNGRIPFVPELVAAELDDAALIGAAEVAIDASAGGATLLE